MKKVVFVFLVMFQSCNTNREKSNDELIRNINSINHVDVKYELLVDSLDSIIDTLSKISLKKDEEQNKIFEEKVIFFKNYFLKITDYYSNGILFFSKKESSVDGLISLYEAQLENKKIKKATTLNYLNGKISDTLNLQYKYFYRDDKTLEKLLISVDDSKVLIKYNEFEQPYLELKEINNVLFTKTAYDYNKSNLLSKKIIKDYEENMFFEFNYDDRGHILSEEVHIKTPDSYEPFQKVTYVTDSEGFVIRKVIHNFSSNKNKFFVYK